VKPAGTLTGGPILVISAMPAPLPPRRSRMSREPSENSYTYFVPAAVVALKAAIDSIVRSSDATKPHVCVILERLGHGAVDLRKRAGCRRGRLFEGRAERQGHERERRAVERKATRR